MYNTNDIIRMVKKAALDVINATKPTEVYFGTVKVVKPLTIDVEQKNSLVDGDNVDLVLTNNVKDHYVDITVSHNTETETCTVGHKHKYSGRKKILMHYGLQVGEKVILIRVQGGQKYIVVDRLENPRTKGEWS